MLYKTFKFKFTEYEKKYMFFSLNFGMKWTHLPSIKGSNSYKRMGKKV